MTWGTQKNVKHQLISDFDCIRGQIFCCETEKREKEVLRGDDKREKLGRFL